MHNKVRIWKWISINKWRSPNHSHSVENSRRWRSVTFHHFYGHYFYSFLFPFSFSVPPHFLPPFNSHIVGILVSEMLLIKRLSLDFTITYDPSQSLTTSWKTNILFYELRGVICSRHKQRMVSHNVSSKEFQGKISPLLNNLSFHRMVNLTNSNFHDHIPSQFRNLWG